MPTVYYKEYGKGPVVLLIHGFCENRDIWKPLLPELALHYRVITIDLPGFGKSPLLPESFFSIKDVAQVVIEQMNTMGIEKCFIVGHSLGGYVALAAASEKPDYFLGLCLFHSTALADSEEKKSNRDKTYKFVKKYGAKPFLETFVPSLFYKKDNKKIPEVSKIACKTSKKAILAYTQAMRNRPDRQDFLKTFEKPLLFLGGVQDTIISVSSLQSQLSITPRGKLAIMPEVGHLGMIEDSDQANQILKDFMKVCLPLRTPNI